MDRKEFVLFISLPNKFFRFQLVHRCTQLALALTPSRKKNHIWPPSHQRGLTFYCWILFF